MSKVAIVATDSGSLQEVVGNGGWLVREADPPRLAAVLRRLARPQEQLATARRGYERAPYRRSWLVGRRPTGRVFSRLSRKPRHCHAPEPPPCTVHMEPRRAL